MKKLKKSQLRNMIKCQKCGKLVSKDLTHKESILIDENDNIILADLCLECAGEYWMDE